MAQLSSPGVSVTVIDESFYTPAAPGTVPLIIVATQQDKMNSAGTGTAPGTTKANAGKVYLLTSQMDLGATFGIPYFQTDAENNPINAGELNEYGLQAAYSFLGVSSRAYVVRADVNTAQLAGSATIPTGNPADGTFWLNTSTSAFGVFQWNANVATTTGGQTFTEQQLAGNFTVITDSTKVDGNYKPLSSYGQQGDYALVALTTLYKLWYKKGKTDTAGGTWVQVGSTAWAASWPAATGTVANPTLTATGTSFTGQIAGTTLTVTSTVTGGSVSVGEVLSNAGNTVTAGTEVTAVNSASFTGTVSGTTLTVTAVASGTIAVGMVITGITPAFTYITANVTGSAFASGGGTSTWTLSASSTGTPTAGTSYTVSASQTLASGTLTTGGSQLTINGTTFQGVSTVTALAAAINVGTAAGITAAAINGYLNLYSTGVDVTISGTAVSALGLNQGTTTTLQSGPTWIYKAPAFTIAPHTSIPTYGRYDNITTVNGYPTGSVWVKSTPINLGANWMVKQYSAATSSWISQPVSLYKDNYTALYNLDPTGGGINLALDQLYVKYNDDEGSPAYGDFKIYFRNAVGPTLTTSNIVTASTFTAQTYTFTVQASQTGSAVLPTTAPLLATVTFIATGAVSDAAAFATAFTAAVSDPLVSIVVNANNSISISHVQGGDILFVDGSNTPLSKLFTPGTSANFNYSAPKIDGVSGASSTTYVLSNWATTVGTTGNGLVTASPTPPTTAPADGTLWYDTSLSEFDIMINDGTAWRGYLTTQAIAINQAVYAGTASPTGVNATDPMGPIVSATQPTAQSDGTPLANGDIWINTSNLENFPNVYKYNSLTAKWINMDETDHTTSNGIVFADARWTDNSLNNSVQTGAGTPATIVSLLSTSYVSYDCPDPALYPKGMLLWNTRRSGYNVKKYRVGYTNTTSLNVRYNNALMTNYYPDSWVTAAANDTMGVAQLGRKAQRAVVLQALEATIQANQNIRQPDTVIYNLLSCPGYTETFSALIGLNTDNGLSAFIVMDPPARLTPDATSLSNWGNNTAGAVIDGEQGLIATNAYSAIYYPWAYTQDLTGNNIVVPPSHIMLRTIALSDNVSYPWFAPAGVRRGGVTNAASVGYVDGQTGEFQTVALNLGQRDTLAGIHVNPITYLAGTGLVVYGQKTRQLVASSLDRINVARLVIYLRYQLNQIAKPYIFEPNDTITRNQIKQQIEKMLLELTAQRALYDFLVVCDSSNNTPARIDRSELWVDIAIEPVKAVEFIYIPMRLENTGAIKGLGK